MNNRFIAIFLLQHISSRLNRPNVARQILNFACFLSLAILSGLLCFIGLTYAISSPPMDLFYPVATPAGNSTIYVPGGGFSGFWFHLGNLQSIESPESYDYYCYSSGCLAALSSLMALSFDQTADAAFDAQDVWIEGSVSRFDIVPHFFDKLVSDDPKSARRLQQILPRLKILVTTQKDGHQVHEATNREELKDLITKTTWIPYILGWGLLAENGDVYYDGGFSRRLHPACEYRLDLPIIWETIVHTFSLGLGREQIRELWHVGHEYNYSVPKRSNTV